MQSALSGLLKATLLIAGFGGLLFLFYSTVGHLPEKLLKLWLLVYWKVILMLILEIIAITVYVMSVLWVLNKKP